MKIEKNVSCNREDFSFVLCLVFCLKKCRSSLCLASGKEYVPGLGKKSVHFLSDLTATAAFLPSQNPRHFPFTDGHPGDRSGAGIKVSLAIIYQIPILARSLPFQKTPPRGQEVEPEAALALWPTDPGAAAPSRYLVSFSGFVCFRACCCLRKGFVS